MIHASGNGRGERRQENEGAQVHHLPVPACFLARLIRFCNDHTSTAVSNVTSCSGDRIFAAGSQTSFQLTLPGSVPIPFWYVASLASAAARIWSACWSVIGSPLS